MIRMMQHCPPAGLGRPHRPDSIDYSLPFCDTSMNIAAFPLSSIPQRRPGTPLVVTTIRANG